MTKKVKAPLTYNPGKGRPKEHLAYLNYQEMQVLKRLNGNNQERGPKGLPSFPPADAMGSSSKASSSKSSASKGTGGKMGSSSSQSGGVSKASAAGKDSGAGRPGGGGSGAGPRSGAAGTRSPTSGSVTGSGKGPSASKDTGGKSPAPRSGLSGTRSPTSGSKLSSSGQKPGGIADLGGGKRATGDTPGTRIKGAIETVKQQTYKPSPAALKAVTRGPGSVTGTMPGNLDPVAQERSLQAITNSINEKLGKNYTPDQVSKMAKAIAGEAAAETPFGQAAVANTMLNRISLASQDPKKYGYMGGTSINKLLSQYDATGMRKGTKANSVYKNTVPGTETYRAGLVALSDAISPNSAFSKTASPRVLNATHYYNPDTANPKWGTRSGKQFEAVGDHVFGNAEKTAGAVSVARSGTIGGNITPASAQATAAPKGGLFSDFKAAIAPAVVRATMQDEVKSAYNKGIDAIKGAQSWMNEKMYGGVPMDASFAGRAQAAGGAKAVAGGTSVNPSQAGALTAEQEKAVNERLGRANLATRGAGILLGLTGIPGAGAFAGQASKAYQKSVKEKLAEYAAAQTPAERKALEEKDPALVGWADIAKMPSYYDQSYYKDWASRTGLRGAPETTGRDAVSSFGGIASLPTAATATPSTTTTPSGTVGGPRPYSHFQWDLGLNIPKPTDTNYPDYQKYLANRAASAAAIESA